MSLYESTLTFGGREYFEFPAGMAVGVYGRARKGPEEAAAPSQRERLAHNGKFPRMGSFVQLLGRFQPFSIYFGDVMTSCNKGTNRVHFWPCTIRDSVLLARLSNAEIGQP